MDTGILVGGVGGGDGVVLLIDQSVVWTEDVGLFIRLLLGWCRGLLVLLEDDDREVVVHAVAAVGSVVQPGFTTISVTDTYAQNV